jgi:hypothetical protein
MQSVFPLQVFDCRFLLGHDSDGTFSNCVKKGCAAICPEGLYTVFRVLSFLGINIDLGFTLGSLTTGKGNRYLHPHGFFYSEADQSPGLF